MLERSLEINDAVADFTDHIKFEESSSLPPP